MANLSGLSEPTKGAIVEDRIKEQILLLGGGQFNVYKPVIDSAGVDLIVVKKGIFHPVFLQVKGSFKLRRNRTFFCDIRMKTFEPHHSYFIVGAYFNPERQELHDKVLFVPTEKLKEEIAGRVRRRIETVLSGETRSKWAPYIIDKKDIASEIERKIEEMEKYFK